MMRRSCVLFLLLAFAWFWCVSGQAAKPPKEPLVDQVRKAIEDGIRFLRQREKDQGNWESEAGLIIHSQIGAGGPTSLTLLALLNAGVKPDDPLIQRGLKYLRTIPPKSTYVVGLQTMVFVEAGQNEDRERIQRNVNWLIDARIMSGKTLQGWSYLQGGANTSDNSNSQYALLGLHAGKTAGAKIDREVWESIRDYYMRNQYASGGWGYRNSDNAATLTMTTAGFCGLLIAGMELNDQREKILPNGQAENCGNYEENKAAAKALNWISTNFKLRDYRPHLYYNVYGIERSGRLSGQRFFGEYDWYRQGCEFLVGAQRDDGSWYGGGGFDRSPVVSTSFALLFLSKGRTPILISKLVHGPVDNPGDDWNNDRNDVRNLVDYASKVMFKKQPLAWQVFNARQVKVENHDELLGLVADLMQSPIAYLNGHHAPRFSRTEEELLKEYVNQGGFILAEACCGRPEFDRGFRELMDQLFGAGELKQLEADHPIWTAYHKVVPNQPFKLYGIKHGCKTVVVYSPQDLSCLWEANQFKDGRGQLAFRLGANIIAYATSMELPKPRLTVHEIVKDTDNLKTVPRGYLKVAQVRHEGDWHPAPKAMRNLMAHLRDKARIDVTLQTEEIALSEKLRGDIPAVLNFKFLYMHGRNRFAFNATELENLRADLNTGGLLFADACCGKKEFDASFRTMIEKLFPDKKLEPIPLNDELYSKELNGTAIATVRCRREGPDGVKPEPEYREVAPYLEGIKLNNRWVVIYSKYDIGCALEKHQSPDCLGHDHASALKLGGAVVLYALKR